MASYVVGVRGPGVTFQTSWKPRKCVICKKPISNPTAKNQKAHEGRCRIELDRQRAETYARKQRAAKKFKRDRKRIGAIAGRKPARDPKYLAFIRDLPCLICMILHELKAGDFARKCAGWIGQSAVQKTSTESAHTGPHALGRKASDRTAIPLCGHDHHREGKLSYHKLGEKKFEAHYRITISEIVKTLNAKYEAGRKAP